MLFKISCYGEKQIADCIRNKLERMGYRSHPGTELTSYRWTMFSVKKGTWCHECFDGHSQLTDFKTIQSIDAFLDTIANHPKGGPYRPMKVPAHKVPIGQLIKTKGGTVLRRIDGSCLKKPMSVEYKIHFIDDETWIVYEFDESEPLALADDNDRP